MHSEKLNEKEILFRMAQSLLNEIKAQQKGMTDVGPYANRYNFLREKTIKLLGKDSEPFIPILSENLTMHLAKYGGWASDVFVRMKFFDEVTVAISQLVSFLETKLEESFRILSSVEEYLLNNLRRSMIRKPMEEKDVQDVIEIMLISKGYVFEREKAKIHYSNKDYKPDFAFEDLNAVLEVKLCKTDRKEKDIIDEINADIPPYTTKYSNVTFLVYDLGIIRDVNSFRKDIEKNNPRIKVLIIKH